MTVILPVGNLAGCGDGSGGRVCATAIHDGGERRNGTHVAVAHRKRNEIPVAVHDGRTNLPAEIPAHASQMYGKNLVTFLEHLLEDGELVLDFSDEITTGTLITHGGAVVNERRGGTMPSPPPSAAAADTGGAD